MKKSIFLAIVFLSTNCFSGFSEISPISKSVDLIIVVDNSGSMVQYQEQLSKNIRYILDDFRDVSTHLGILTTGDDFTGKKKGVFIGPNQSGTFDELIDKTSKALLVGINGNGTETPFDSILSALSPELLNDQNKGFLRENTPLYIVIVTDSEDQSNMTYKDFVVDLIKLKGDANIQAYGYLAYQPETCVGESDQKDNTKIRDFVNFFKGKVFSLCDSDWSINKVNYVEPLL